MAKRGAKKGSVHNVTGKGGLGERPEAINKTGRPKGAIGKVSAELRAAAQQYTTECLEILMKIARDVEAPHAARVSAASAVLDRGHGKPAQAITDPDGGNVIVKILQFGAADA